MKMNKKRIIYLDKPFELVDGLFEQLDETDGNLTVRIRFVEDCELIYPVDSPEARILREKLTGELKGERVIICRLDGEDEPLRVAIKREEAM